MDNSHWRETLRSRLNAELAFGNQLLERIRERASLLEAGNLFADVRDWMESTAFAIFFASDGSYLPHHERIGYDPRGIQTRPSPNSVTAAIAEISAHLELLTRCHNNFCVLLDDGSIHFAILEAIGANGGGLPLNEAVKLASNLSSAQSHMLIVALLELDVLKRSDDNAEILLTSAGWEYLRLLGRGKSMVPIEIEKSLERFHSDHPSSKKAAFVMMRFGTTKMHSQVLDVVRQTLNSRGISCLRADGKSYHDDLYFNLLTYMHGCGFGIAICERIEQDEFNPNVSLEVGYMLALQKNVCLLKDKTFKTLPTDLVGKLYRSFDVFDLKRSVNSELTHWLEDKGYT